MLALVLLATITVAAPNSAGAQPAASVVIAEFLAVNPGPFVDEDGDSSDWLELHNDSAQAQSMAGWTLRDSGATWALPDIALQPGERIIVWASGKSRFDAAGPLHTSFKLTSNGEYLGLHDETGAVIDAYAPSFPAQSAGVSYGIASDGSTGFLTAPTPGTANGDLAQVRAAQPTATIGNRFTDTATTETLVSETPNASIHYTVDGSIPTAAAAIAANGIVAIPASSPLTTVRAVAIAPGMAPSPIATFTYVHPAATATSIQGGALETAGIAALPVMSITTASGVEVAEIENYESVRLDYIETGGGGFSSEVGAKQFGAWSLQRNKRNFRLNYSSEFGPKQLDYPLFADRGQGIIEPASSFDQLELRAYSLDSFEGPNPLLASNEFARSLMLGLGSPNSHGRPVGVYVNGAYRGIYQLRERINEDWLSEYLGGNGDDYESWFIDDTLETTDLNSGTGEVFTAIDEADNYQQVRDLVDARALVNSALVLWNYATYTEREWRVLGPSDPNHPGGFIWIPNDLDLAFTRRYVAGRSNGMRDFIARFAADPEFAEILHDQAANAFCGDGEMTVSKMQARLSSIVEEIRATIPAEVRAWDWNRTVAHWESNVATAEARLVAGLAQTVAQWQAAGWFTGCGRAPAVQVAPSLGSVQHRAVAFTVNGSDADGDAVTLTSTGLPDGITMTEQGAISGQAQSAGSFDVTIRATDTNGQWSETTVPWQVVAAPPVANIEAAIVRVNEINSVSANEPWTGTDAAFGTADNGGDWFELVTTVPEADLRGWSVELWDRRGAADTLELRDTFQFTDHASLIGLPQGSVITISEDHPDDTVLAPPLGDFHLNANASSNVPSVLLESQGRSNFATDRSGLRILVRDAAGTAVSDFVGETETWLSVNPGGAAQGVLSTCAEVTHSPTYSLEEATSTFGVANVCGAQLQDLASVRAYQPYGDVNCDGKSDIVDSLLISQFIVGNRTSASCPLPAPRTQLALVNADADRNETADIVDALLIARCSVGIVNPVCPVE